MTSRDTYDIEQHEKELKSQSINVQPRLLVNLMIDSEPSLFNPDNKPAIEPYKMPPNLQAIYTAMLQITKWHANLQVEFDKQLAETK